MYGKPTISKLEISLLKLVIDSFFSVNSHIGLFQLASITVYKKNNATMATLI